MLSAYRMTTRSECPGQARQHCSQSITGHRNHSTLVPQLRQTLVGGVNRLRGDIGIMPATLLRLSAAALYSSWSRIRVRQLSSAPRSVSTKPKAAIFGFGRHTMRPCSTTTRAPATMLLASSALSARLRPPAWTSRCRRRAVVRLRHSRWPDRAYKRGKAPAFLARFLGRPRQRWMSV
jgi:hypothetical protein